VNSHIDMIVVPVLPLNGNSIDAKRKMTGNVDEQRTILPPHSSCPGERASRALVESGMRCALIQAAVPVVL
jgi:hypothetical protein